jgi:hypothetical protein
MENGYFPWLSIATAVFEIAAAAWVLRGAGRPAIKQRTALVLVLLAAYQIAEVWVCSDPDALVRARLAFCCIVWLPTAGLSLMAQYEGGPSPRVALFLKASVLWCCVLCVWVLVDPTFVTGTVCSTVLATFSHDAMLFHYAFGGFYEFGLLAVMLSGTVVMRRAESPLTRAHAADLQMGTILFVIPAFVTQVIWRDLDPSLPSLMCHYALILALFMVRASLREQRAAA